MTEEPTGAASFDVAAGAAAIASELGAGGEGGGAPASNSAVTGASPPLDAQFKSLLSSLLTNHPL